MSYGSEGMKALINKTVNRIWVSEDDTDLVFDTDEGPVAFHVEGDCCSSSWFADLIGVKALLGWTVLAAEETPLPNYNVDDGRGRQEEDSVYGYKLTTAQGYCDVIFRNSSNGYYGGWMEQVEGGVNPALIEITDDWQA